MSIEGSYKKLAAANLQRIEQYVKRIEQLFSKATGRFISLSTSLPYDRSAGDQFYFADYPEVRREVDKLVSSLARGMESAIVAGTTAEWTHGTEDANGILDYVLNRAGIKDTEGLKDSVIGQYLNNHNDALRAFQQRQIGGLTLSRRVWNLAEQRKIETELARSIADGTSASALAESMQEYLNEPSKLFRRVRNEFGVLRLSRNARAYNPGEGVYRSSYKNALRLARTEINMAYRNAEQESYADKEYVVGIEIKRSNNPYDCVLCESLAGKYPKDFKWSGWHPNCRCYMVPITVTNDEFIDMLGDDEFSPEKSKNYIGDVPDSFKQWCEDHQAKIEDANQWGTLPYFLQDNRDYMWEALSNDSRMLRELSKTVDSYPVEYRDEIRRMVEQRATAPMISAGISNIADDITQSVLPYSVQMYQQSAVMRGLYDKLVALPKTDFKARIDLANQIKQKAAVLTRWNLRKAGAVDGLDYFGFEGNHTFHPGGDMKTSSGVTIKVDRYRKDVVKYKDAAGKEYWFPLGAKGSNIPFSAKEASEVVSSMYPGMQKSFKALMFDTGRHPLDRYYAVEYSSPGFRGAAYSGEPISFHVNLSRTQFVKTLSHEIGHHLDGSTSATKAWAEAIAKDGGYISEYAKKSVSEDFAEHFAYAYECLSDRNLGLDWFNKLFPNRWNILRDIFIKLI